MRRCVHAAEAESVIHTSGTVVSVWKSILETFAASKVTSFLNMALHFYKDKMQKHIWQILQVHAEKEEGKSSGES